MNMDNVLITHNDVLLFDSSAQLSSQRREKRKNEIQKVTYGSTLDPESAIKYYESNIFQKFFLTFTLSPSS